MAVFGTSGATTRGALLPLTSTAVMMNVLVFGVGSGSERYMKGSNLTDSWLQRGHRNVDLYLKQTSMSVKNLLSSALSKQKAYNAAPEWEHATTSGRCGKIVHQQTRQSYSQPLEVVHNDGIVACAVVIPGFCRHLRVWPSIRVLLFPIRLHHNAVQIFMQPV